MILLLESPDHTPLEATKNVPPRSRWKLARPFMRCTALLPLPPLITILEELLEPAEQDGPAAARSRWIASEERLLIPQLSIP
jgi:hypothetical protein